MSLLKHQQRSLRQRNQQEDRIEAILKSAKDLQAQLSAKQNDLNKLVTSYAFESR